MISSSITAFPVIYNQTMGVYKIEHGETIVAIEDIEKLGPPCCIPERDAAETSFVRWSSLSLAKSREN